MLYHESTKKCSPRQFLPSFFNNLYMKCSVMLMNIL